MEDFKGEQPLPDSTESIQADNVIGLCSVTRAILDMLPFSVKESEELWEIDITDVVKIFGKKVNVYMVFQVLESLLVVTKIGQKIYRYNGFDKLPTTLHFLQKLGFNLEFSSMIEMAKNGIGGVSFLAEARKLNPIYEVIYQKLKKNCFIVMSQEVIMMFLNARRDSLLNHLDDAKVEPARNHLEECRLCHENRATMQTFPCEHQVLCRPCFVKTIHMTVEMRKLPLRCVLCNGKIISLQQNQFRKARQLPKIPDQNYFEIGRHSRIASRSDGYRSDSSNSLRSSSVNSSSSAFSFGSNASSISNTSYTSSKPNNANKGFNFNAISSFQSAELLSKSQISGSQRGYRSYQRSRTSSPAPARFSSQSNASRISSMERGRMFDSSLDSFTFISSSSSSSSTSSRSPTESSASSSPRSPNNIFWPTLNTNEIMSSVYKASPTPIKRINHANEMKYSSPTLRERTDRALFDSRINALNGNISRVPPDTYHQLTTPNIATSSVPSSSITGTYNRSIKVGASLSPIRESRRESLSSSLDFQCSPDRSPLPPRHQFFVPSQHDLGIYRDSPRRLSRIRYTDRLVRELETTQAVAYLDHEDDTFSRNHRLLNAKSNIEDVRNGNLIIKPAIHKKTYQSILNNKSPQATKKPKSVSFKDP